MLPVRPARLVGWLLLLGASAFFVALAPYGLNLDDEGTILYQIYRTAVGQVLYVDFHAGYTPGVFWFNALLFRLFEPNILVLRIALALVNAAAVLLLYLLARRIGVRPAAAAAGALMYVALIPYYDGQFFSANIPYPIWYVTLAWLASLLAGLRAWWTARSVWWLVAGVCSGVVFAFKPNSGLLCLAGTLISLVILQAPEVHTTGRAALQRSLAFLLRYGIPLVLLSGIVNLFVASGWREVALFAAPLVVLVLFLLRQRLSLSRPVTPERLALDVILAGGGFAAVNLPWVLYYWQQLGTRGFLRAILFVGTGFDKLYFISYPPPSSWALALIAMSGALVAIGALCRARIVPRFIVVASALAVAAAGAFYLNNHPPPMVEGLQRAVVSRVRDIAFLVSLAVQWSALLAAGLVWLRFRVSRPAAQAMTPLRVRQAGALLIVVIGAVLMHMQLYPRTDFMHLVPAIPLILVLGSWLLDRVARIWALALARRLRSVRLLRFAATLPLYALILVLLMPALRRIDYLVRAWIKNDAGAIVYLDPERAPLVIEPAASRTFESLRLAAQYVRQHTQPQETLFAFPVLDLLCFLSDRHNPTRHGYFFPGWPGHAVEAEVIDSLRQMPPRYVVTLHDHTFFFATAPIYYFDLRRFVLSNYRLERRLGMFDVLQPAATTPHEVPAALDTDLIAIWRAELRRLPGATARRLESALGQIESDSAQAIADLLSRLDGRAQRQLVLLVRKSRSTTGATALALGLETGALAPAAQELATRVIGEIADIDAIPPLLRARAKASAAERDKYAGLLYTVASKLALENYWYGLPADRALSRLAAFVPSEQVIEWIEDSAESIALRSFAIRLSAALDYREAAPALARVLGDLDEWSDLRVQAADALETLATLDVVLPAVANLLRFDTVTAPGLVAGGYSARPDATRPILLKLLTDGDARVRANAAWVAAAVRDAELSSALLTALYDPTPEVRMAAVWGLHEIGTEEAMEAVRRTTGDADDEVAQFARRLLRPRSDPT